MALMMHLRTVTVEQARRSESRNHSERCNCESCLQSMRDQLRAIREMRTWKEVG